MKLLFLSDTQLGGGEVYGTPERSRLADAQLALGDVVWIAHEREVDLLIFAGDAFDRRRPAIDELLTFRRFLDALPCEYRLVPGNHDVRGPGLPTTLALFGGPQGFRLHDRPSVDRLDDVGFGWLPWSHPGPMRAAREGATPLEQAEALLKIAEGMSYDLGHLKTRILVTHHALSGMSLPNGLSTGELVGEPVLDTQALLEQGWSAVIAGHVHKYDVVARDVHEPGIAVSIGSPWIQDFGEADGSHGVLLFDTDSGVFEHVPLEGRRFVTIDLDGSEAPDAYSGADVAGAVVRVRIRCNEEAARALDIDALRRQLIAQGAHKVHAVTLDVERKVRARAESMAEDAGPLAALDGWLRATNQGPRECERLGDLTRQLLEQEV